MYQWIKNTIAGVRLAYGVIKDHPELLHGEYAAKQPTSETAENRKPSTHNKRSKKTKGE